MAAHSSILAWRISWTEEPGRLQSGGSQRAEHNGCDLARTQTPALAFTSAFISLCGSELFSGFPSCQPEGFPFASLVEQIY